MEVDTKSPLHPIVQVTNQLSHEQIYILHLEEADQRGLFNAKDNWVLCPDSTNHQDELLK